MGKAVFISARVRKHHPMLQSVKIRREEREQWRNIASIEEPREEEAELRVSQNLGKWTPQPTIQEQPPWFSSGLVSWVD